MRQSDKLQRIKDKLVKVADADLTEVTRARAAVRKMMDLGYTPGYLMGCLDANPPKPGTVFDDEPFMGFANRAEATRAAVYSMSSPQRPGVFSDSARRVEMLIKAQEPERAATTIGLAVVSVPAMMGPTATAEVKRFQRTPEGKLREITAGGVIELEEAAESVFTMKKERP
jgi:hypothetical protein